MKWFFSCQEECIHRIVLETIFHWVRFSFNKSEKQIRSSLGRKATGNKHREKRKTLLIHLDMPTSLSSERPCRGRKTVCVPICQFVPPPLLSFVFCQKVADVYMWFYCFSQYNTIMGDHHFTFFMGDNHFTIFNGRQSFHYF